MENITTKKAKKETTTTKTKEKQGEMYNCSAEELGIGKNEDREVHSITSAQLNKYLAP